MLISINLLESEGYNWISVVVSKRIDVILALYFSNSNYCHNCFVVSYICVNFAQKQVNHSSVKYFSHIIVLATFVFFVACGSTDGRCDIDVLAHIDSLTMVNADSARKMLNALKKEVADALPEVKAYYDFLCVKAADKAMVTHTSDTLINSVLEYYQNSEDKSRLPETYYYCGRVNADMQNGERALYYFQKALIEDSAKVSDYLKSRIYAQMGYVYLRNGLFDEARSMQELAYFYSKQDGDTLGMRYSMEDIKTISNLSEKLGDSIGSNSEMLIRVQKLNEQIKSQELYRQNKYLQEHNSQGNGVLWIVILSATIFVAICLAVVVYIKKRARVGNETAAIEQVQQPLVKRKFYDKEINALIAERLNAGKVLRQTDWNKIETALLESFPNFKDNLFSLYEMSETEYHICLLIKLQMSPSNMAKLLATSNSTISNCRLRMQQKVFEGVGTSKDWDNYVLSL